METIRNYLENMFLNLPNTPEVYKAKNELWQILVLHPLCTVHRCSQPEDL